MTPGAAMIFAAGFGRRMGPLTADRPKPLIEVGGRPLIDHALDVVAGAGIRRTVVNLHYRADQMARYLDGRDVALSHEVPRLLDTGGGLKAALPLLGPGPVATVNSDAVWLGPNPLAITAAAWQDGREALLLLVPLDRAIGRMGGGDFALDADGRPHRGGDLVYTGVQILRTERVARWPESVFSLNRVWDAMAAEGRLGACVYPGRWGDVGHPEGLAEAERLLADA